MELAILCQIIADAANESAEVFVYLAGRCMVGLETVC